MIRALLAAALALWAGACRGQAPAPAAEVSANLERVVLTLSDDEPYRFVLHYSGPTMPFRGALCYAFAGYNETCTRPRVKWLTPATDIELWAPGGVPRELLQGYVMLVRYPALSQRTYRYRLTAPGKRPRSP